MVKSFCCFLLPLLADFQLSTYSQNPGEMEKLESARAATAALYERWEELQAIADAGE
jgi:hypothetical protein